MRDCKSTRECVYCKLKANHNRSLCPKQFGPQQVIPAEVNVPALKQVGGVGAIDEQVIMQTARVQLMNRNDETIYKNARLLLDCGSQRTYISKYMADKLRLKEVGKDFLVVYTFGTSKPDNIETPVVEIGLRLNSGFIMRMKANVIPNTHWTNTESTC